MQEILSGLTLTPEVERYALGRGASSESLRDLRVGTWALAQTPCPDLAFVKRYGPHGEKLQGKLIAPYFAPRGEFVGFESRNVRRKFISDVRLPEAKRWCPTWLGLSPARMKAIWEGCDVWLVEGLFDLFPLELVVPKGDVVLASITAMLSHNQARFLSRFLKGQLHVVYDMDKGGRKGSEKVKTWMDSLGVRCRRVEYRGGDDPGEIWDKGGEIALRQAFWHI